MEMNADTWMNELKERLLPEFGDRLVLLGLQGSRGRGEERPSSDIDVVLVVDGLDISAIEDYKRVLSDMPQADLACGFVSSPKILAAWPRYDSFNLVMDTRIIHGSFDFMDEDYTVNDAREAAKAGASMIYHAVCHGLLFDSSALSGIVADCVKSSFFVMRALTYARTGEYPATRARMRELASDDEITFLDAYDRLDSVKPEEVAQQLLTWASIVLEGLRY